MKTRHRSTLVIFAALLAATGCGTKAERSPSAAEPTRASTSNTANQLTALHPYRDEANRLRALVPAGWHVAHQQLTQLAEPRQVFAVSSFRLRQTKPDNNCTPRTAIREMGRGSFVFVIEDHNVRPRPRRSYKPRPDRFTFSSSEYVGHECFGDAYAWNFRDLGRFFLALIYLDPKRTPAPTQTAALRALDSLRVQREAKKAASMADDRCQKASPHLRMAGDPVQGYGSVWTRDLRAGTVMQADPRTRATTRTIHLALPKPLVPGDSAFLPYDIALGGGFAWVSTARGFIAQIEPRRGRVIRMLRVPQESTGMIIWKAGALWVAENLGGILRIDPRTGRRTSITPAVGRGRRLSVSSLTFGDGAICARGVVTRPGSSVVSVQDAAVRIDPRSGRAMGEPQFYRAAH